MGAKLSDILSRVNELTKIPTTSIMTTADRRDLIVRAVREYSLRRPYFGIYAQTAGSLDYYSLPSDFEDGFSSILEIEYPITSTPKEVIESDDYDIDIMSDGKKLRFSSNSPTSGEIFWIKYTKRHTFDSSDLSTVPLADELGVAYLACSIICNAIASYYSGRAEANLTSIEIPNMPSRSDDWQGRADTWYEKYDKIITESTTGLEGYVQFARDMYFERKED